MEIKCSVRQAIILVLFTCTILTSIKESECGKRNKSRDSNSANRNIQNNSSSHSNSDNNSIRRSSKFSQNLHSPLLPLPPQERSGGGATSSTTSSSNSRSHGKSKRGSRDQIKNNNNNTSNSNGTSKFTGKTGQAKQSWLAVASAVAHSTAAETNPQQLPIGDDSKPTKYHYYPHNQHLYLLPECATQQVCSAVYLRLNYSQPLCACPNFHEPCSVSTRTDDRHTIPLVTGSQSPVLTLVKTCEPTLEVRECRAPKDWSILALQNSRTGKAHYLVICRCPAPGYLEGPIAHSQPAYARVPGIRVYGMTCVRSSTRAGRLLNNDITSEQTEEARGSNNPDFPWQRLKQLLHSTGLIS